MDSHNYLLRVETAGKNFRVLKKRSIMVGKSFREWQDQREKKFDIFF